MRDTLEHEKRLDVARQLWNEAAPSFDEAPDHGLHDPIQLAAWTILLKGSLPFSKGKVVDIGCGTGSLSTILAGLGYDVTGIDVSPAMLALAEAKAIGGGHAIKFYAMDAAYLQLPAQHFDAIVSRHLLWALPDPDQVLQRWIRLLKPGGRLLLIEGYWHTGAGLPAQEIVETLPASLTNVVVQNLSDQADLWGGAVTDERYLITAVLRS